MDVFFQCFIQRLGNSGNPSIPDDDDDDDDDDDRERLYLP